MMWSCLLEKMMWSCFLEKIPVTITEPYIYSACLKTTSIYLEIICWKQLTNLRSVFNLPVLFLNSWLLDVGQLTNFSGIWLLDCCGSHFFLCHGYAPLPWIWALLCLDLGLNSKLYFPRHICVCIANGVVAFVINWNIICQWTTCKWVGVFVQSEPGYWRVRHFQGGTFNDLQQH